MTKLDLIIIGAGGFGRELHTMLWDGISRDEYQFKGFLANESNDRVETHGPVIGSPEDYQPQKNDRFLLAIGAMEVRARLTQLLTDRGGQFASFVHHTAYIADNATVGVDAVIYPFAVVSNAASVADHVHLNYYASVGHDATVGRYCLLAPYATLNGFTALEDQVYMSTHATVVVEKRVGARSKISANTSVQHDVPADSFVFGVPGKVIRKGGIG